MFRGHFLFELFIRKICSCRCGVWSCKSWLVHHGMVKLQEEIIEIRRRYDRNYRRYIYFWCPIFLGILPCDHIMTAIQIWLQWLGFWMTFFGGILISFVPGSASCVDCGDLSQKVATYICNIRFCLSRGDIGREHGVLRIGISPVSPGGFFLQLVFGGLGQPIPPGVPNSQPPDHEVLQEPLNPTLLKAAVALVSIKECLVSYLGWQHCPCQNFVCQIWFHVNEQVSYSFYQLPHLASTLIFDMLSNPIENAGWCADIVATSQSQRCFCFLLSKVTRAWMDSPAIRELQHASIVAVETRQRQETPAAPNVACLERRARGAMTRVILGQVWMKMTFRKCQHNLDLWIYCMNWPGCFFFFPGSFPPNIGSAHSTVHIHLVEAANTGLLLGRLQKYRFSCQYNVILNHIDLH